MDNKELLEKYNRTFMYVKTAVNEWNPYGLLPHAGQDEFHVEIRMIINRINDNTSVDELAQIISSVFIEQFNDKSFTVNNCYNTAKRIIALLHNQNNTV